MGRIGLTHDYSRHVFVAAGDGDVGVIPLSAHDGLNITQHMRGGIPGSKYIAWEGGMVMEGLGGGWGGVVTYLY